LDITADQIKALRKLTGAGIMDCKRALEQASGNLDEAQIVLREKGLSSAEKKASRITEEGLVESYIHSGGRLGAIIEVNCETDFVARTPEFKTLAHNLAMQVAAMAPSYVDSTDIPEDVEASPQEVSLLQQPFIKDQTMTVQDILKETISKMGENVKVRRFTRFSLGE
jgi:elongation factor Ts